MGLRAALGAGSAEINATRVIFRLIALEKISNRSKNDVIDAELQRFENRSKKILEHILIKILVFSIGNQSLKCTVLYSSFKTNIFSFGVLEIMKIPRFPENSENSEISTSSL